MPQSENFLTRGRALFIARRHAVITCKLYTKFVTFTVAIRKKFE
mgnify:CR=1 FL=1